MSSPFLSNTEKCDAPTAFGTSTNVVGVSARMLRCAGLPITMLPASISSFMISDLSGVRRIASCVVSEGSALSGFVDVLIVGRISMNFDEVCPCAWALLTYKQRPPSIMPRNSKTNRSCF